MDANLRRGCTVARFFDVLEQEAPEVLKDLAGMPWQAYQEWLEGDRVGRREAGLTWGHKGLRFAGPPEVREALLDWAHRWNLLSDRVLHWGAWTLYEWELCEGHRFKVSSRQGKRLPGEASYWGGGEAPPVPAWNPAEESRSDAEQRWSEHLKQQKAVARKYGWDDIPLKRARSQDPDLHFRVFIWWQVKKMAWREVRERTECWLGGSSVREAVSVTAALLGIRRRRGIGGRPAAA